jgi:DNA-binding transcriptional MerR regulator
MIQIKIGEFSKKYSISKETIRYYTDKKILLPYKIRHYYDYNDQCEKDIEVVKKFKKMAFSLMEIKEILNYLRLEEEAFPNLNEILLDYFENKLSVLEDERKVILNKEKVLKKEIDTIKISIKNSSTQTKVNSGIDLDFLSILSCRKCNSVLNLKKATINNNEILEGVLQCTCGMEYKIHAGILYCEGVNSDRKVPCVNNKQEIEEKYPTDYNAIKTLAENRLRKKIETDLSFGDFILDLSLMGGVHAQKFLEDGKQNNLFYIGCERWFDFLKVSKKTIDSLKNKPKTLFCCGDIKHAPFKANQFDKIVDVYGTTTDMRETGDYKLKEKINLLKEQGRFYGNYCDISNLSDENTENFRKCFDFKAIKSDLGTLNEIDIVVSPKTKEMGELTPFLKKNGMEEFAVYNFIGEKRKHIL